MVPMINAGISDKFTNREMEVLQLLAEGCSNKQIAENLNVSVRTIKFHTANIYEKIKVTSRSSAIAWIWKNRESFEIS
jgi:DNA-binding NarL/FixJ family response regulator